MLAKLRDRAAKEPMQFETAWGPGRGRIACDTTHVEQPIHLEVAGQVAELSYDEACDLRTALEAALATAWAAGFRSSY